MNNTNILELVQMHMDKKNKELHSQDKIENKKLLHELSLLRPLFEELNPLNELEGIKVSINNSLERRPFPSIIIYEENSPTLQIIANRKIADREQTFRIQKEGTLAKNSYTLTEVIETLAKHVAGVERLDRQLS